MKITTAQDKTYEVSTQKSVELLNGEPFTWDLEAESAVRFHALHKNKSMRLELVRADWEKKEFEVKVNDKLYQLTAKDRFDLLLEELGMESVASTKAADLKAPMPGLVVSVEVEAGQEVAEGEKLLVLEAMKMENVLKAAAAGVVKEVNVSEGANVQKGEVMIIFES